MLKQVMCHHPHMHINVSIRLIFRDYLLKMADIFFLWEINVGIIQGANLYYVTDCACIMCRIVNWVHKNIFK